MNNNALAIVRVAGLSNVIKLFDLLIKNTYMEVVKISFETGGGCLNVILRGELGQIKEGEFLLKDFFERRNIQYQVLIIPNFDFGIVEKDDKNYEFKKT